MSDPRTMKPHSRVRTLTAEGKQLFDYYLNKHTDALIKSRKQLEEIIANETSTADGITTVFEQYRKLSRDFIDFLNRSSSEESFTQLASHKVVFGAMESKKDIAIQQRVTGGQQTISRKLLAPKHEPCDDYERPLREPQDRLQAPSTSGRNSVASSHKSRSSKDSSRHSGKQSSSKTRSSRHSDLSSQYIREKMKAEVAKVRYKYAEQEALLEKDKALKRAELKVMRSEKRYAEAKAKLDVMDEYMNDNRSTRLSGLEELSAHDKVERYLSSQGSMEPLTLTYTKTPPANRNVLKHRVPSISPVNMLPPLDDTTSLRPDAPDFVSTQLRHPDTPGPVTAHTEYAASQENDGQRTLPKMIESGLANNSPTEQHSKQHSHSSQPVQEIVQPDSNTQPKQQNPLAELSKFLMKKDLMLHRLSQFNDRAETYLVWKTTFKNVVSDLEVSPKEEIDLIIKYLGPESRRQAQSLHIANASQPELALSKIWSRLEDRYASPELIEQSLRYKLNNFTKITNHDKKRLYELSDLLAEILSIKEQEKYRNLMAYYDSSTGVNPIVVKLPAYLQNKWTEHASRYKKTNDVIFPPFEIFVNFINEHAIRANDPSFDYTKQEPRSTSQLDREKKPGTSAQPSRLLNTRKTELQSDKEQKPISTCPLHNTQHSLNDCKAFQRKSLEERRKFMREKGVCFKCCAVNDHIAKNCKTPISPCSKCGSKKHCTALHVTEPEQTSAEDTGLKQVQEVKSTCTSLGCEQFSGRSCAKIVLLRVYKKSSPDLFQLAYAIIDDQSNHSLATTDFFTAFNENGPETEYLLSTCAGTFTTSGRSAPGYVAESLDHEFSIDLEPLIECNDIPTEYKEIPTPEIASHYTHLKNIAEFIPVLNENTPIMLLLGRDTIEAHHVIEQVIGPHDQPFAQRLKLGWVIIGKLCNGDVHKPDVVNVNKTKLLNSGRPTLFDPCDNYLITSKLPTEDQLSKTTADVLRRTQEALQKGGNLRLHKISSNCSELMKSFPSEDLADNLKEINIKTDSPPLQRSLGIYWNISTDTFTCRVSNEKKPFTKRGILSTVGSLYDPLGFLAPVINRGKMFFRKIMNMDKGWDDPLPAELEQEWIKWNDSLKELESLNIFRCYGSGLFYKVRRELHVFSDASTEAISAVAFIRTFDKDGTLEVSFVLGKAKLAPSGGHTVPRLELCAAVLATQLKDTILLNLESEIHAVKMYTDSKIVLGYIYNSSRRFYVYVGNRVQKIRNSTEPKQWSYISTDSNPADAGSRSISTSKMNDSIWINGPEFLYTDTADSVAQPFHYPLLNPETDKDIRTEVNVAKNELELKSNSTIVKTFEKFSDWNKLVRTISYLIHIARSFKKHTTGCKGWHVCDAYKEPELKQDTQRFILLQVQREVFGKEIYCLQQEKRLPSVSRILQLSPYLDEHGLLRVGGRLNKLKRSTSACINNTNPIIIPGRSHIGTLLIRHYHSKIHHQGRHLTEGSLRAAGFWLVGGRRAISSYIHSCVTCRKLRGDVLHQKMADLPVARITPSPPFTHVGVDVFGPIGRIVDTFPGDDGLVRKVQVKIFRKTECTTVIRPISELVLLFSD